MLVICFGRNNMLHKNVLRCCVIRMYSIKSIITVFAFQILNWLVKRKCALAPIVPRPIEVNLRVFTSATTHVKGKLPCSSTVELLVMRTCTVVSVGVRS